MHQIFDVERVENQGATRTPTQISAKAEVIHLILVDQ
jgi:hypothetical protein